MTITLPDPEPVSYDAAFEYLMLWEDSHPVSGKITEDGGGLTKYGISSKAYPNIVIETLTIETAKGLYLRDYWSSLWTKGLFTQELANKHFQIKVNLGATGYVRLMNCVDFLPGMHMYNFDSLCLAQLVHYKEHYRSLEFIPGGLRKRALG